MKLQQFYYVLAHHTLPHRQPIPDITRPDGNQSSKEAFSFYRYEHENNISSCVKSTKRAVVCGQLISPQLLVKSSSDRATKRERDWAMMSRSRVDRTSSRVSV